jgi:hypothetical protein
VKLDRLAAEEEGAAHLLVDLAVCNLERDLKLLERQLGQPQPQGCTITGTPGDDVLTGTPATT